MSYIFYAFVLLAKTWWLWGALFVLSLVCKWIGANIHVQ